MAVHHSATITPTKLELLQAWVPHQPWLDGADASTLTQLGAYRFDDPDGEVGVETHLLGTADARVLQVPLTYRGQPREGAEASLVTTMTHTTLGDRWVYDGCHDPVYRAALARTVLTGGRQADLFLATADGLVPQPITAQVRGSGSLPDAALSGWQVAAVTHAGPLTWMRGSGTLTLLRTPGSVVDGLTLTGTWSGQASPLLLATLDGVS